MGSSHQFALISTSLKIGIFSETTATYLFLFFLVPAVSK